MKNYRILLLLAVMLSMYSGGCMDSNMNVQVKIPSSDLVGKCRVNLVTSNEAEMATEVRKSLQEMLVKSYLAARDPVLASYGLNCDFTLNRRYANQNEGTTLIFVTLKVEFVRLDTQATVRKTILHGHASTKPEVVGLVKDMVAGFFDEFSQATSFTVPAAKGWTGYDKLGRKQLAAGDTGNAIENFKLAIDSRPDDHAAHYNLGVAYESLNRKDQALKCYQRAYQIEPERMYQNAILRVSK